MRRYALAFAVALVAGCDGGVPTTVTPSSAPPGSSDAGPPPTPGPTPTPTPGDMGSNGGGAGGGGGGVDGGTGGADGGSGDGGTACTDTQPVAVTRAGTNAFALAADDSDVYFTAIGPNSKDASVWRAPLRGGAAVEVGAPDEYVKEVTVNATAFFTVDNVGTVLRWAKAGGLPLELRPPDGRILNHCLADALGYIYVCSYAADGSVQVMRAPEDGGGAWTGIVIQDGLSSIAFDPQHLWYDGVGAIRTVAPDGSGGASMTIPWNGSTLLWLAVDDSHVFAGTQAGSIVVADKRDGATLTNFAQTSGLPQQLLVDGGNLYAVIDAGDARNRYSQIMRYATDGSSSAMLVGMAGTVGRMAIRGPYLYFAHVDDSTVYRVCK